MGGMISVDNLPTATHLLEAVQTLKLGDFYLWSANGDWVATGVYLDHDGRLRLKMVNAAAVDWDRSPKEDEA